MSDSPDRAGGREGRRGLQSVVKLYLSRPPKRAFAWPEAEPEVEHDLASDAPTPPPRIPEAGAVAFETIDTAPNDLTPRDPSETIAAPPIELDIEEAGEGGGDEAAFEALGIFEPPEPVLSGISLDLELERPSDRFLLERPDDRFLDDDALPAPEIGSEALRAELAFKLEEHLGVGDEPGEEIEILFHEDEADHADRAGTAPTGVADLPESALAEIFDLVDRSLALGPEPVMDVPATREPREGDWDILPAEEPVDDPPFLGETVAEPVPADPVVDPVASPEISAETLTPPIALFLSTLPPRLRRRLLDTLAAPMVAVGRRVLFLEPDPSEDEAGGLIEEVLGLDTAVWRRSLGASPREILLMRPAQRDQLFGALAEEERRSELVLLGIGLPESIFCPRMLPLVDTVIVGLTRQESSLYEAYRALRGLPERRPGLTPYAVTIASSAEEAALLFERFRGIATDFLRMPVIDGGWLGLEAMGQGSPVGDFASGHDSGPGIAPDLRAILSGAGGATGVGYVRVPGEAVRSSEVEDGRPERAFFERLADWFGPATR